MIKKYLKNLLLQLPMNWLYQQMLSVAGVFSEDIDLSYSAESGRPGDARKKKLKNTIVNIMEEYGFTITNLDMTRSRRNYNCYRADYPSMYNKNNILKPELVPETYDTVITGIQKIIDSSVWNNSITL